MIDPRKIWPERANTRIFIELLVNAPQILLMFYGLKCIVSQHGQMLQSTQSAVYRSWHLAPVSGMTAVMAGLLYFTFGLFMYLSDGNPPPENRAWFWRLGRGLLRWGSLAAALFCLVEVNNLATGRGLDLSGLPPGFLVQIIGFIAGVITALSFLGAMYQREQVKRELCGAGCQPLHIWWRPAAYWMCRHWFRRLSATGFRVIYSDPAGRVHKGYCFVYRSFLTDWQWGNREVQWLTDTVTSPTPSTEVWADNEVLRPRLEAGDTVREPDYPPTELNDPWL